MENTNNDAEHSASVVIALLLLLVYPALDHGLTFPSSFFRSVSPFSPEE